MDFKQTVPKRVSQIDSIWMILKALVYLNIKFDSGTFTGGLLWKFARPIIFSILFSYFVSLLMGGGKVVESFKTSYLCFTFFFYILDQIGSSATLASKDNLLNLPRVNHFTLILSQQLSGLVLLVPQALIALIIYFFILDTIKIYVFMEAFISTWLLSLAIYIIVSLLLYENAFITQLYQLFTRSLIFISAILFPLESLPDPLRTYFLINPIVHVMEICREFSGYAGEIIYSQFYLYGYILLSIIAFPLLYFIRINLIFYGRGSD